jgi:uncharacterized protein (TIGR02588 family)
MAAGANKGAVRPRGAARGTPLSERIVAALGALFVLGSIGFLIYHAVGRDESPPDVRIVAAEIREQRNGYLVRFRALNEGGSAAAGLTVAGELSETDGAVVERSETRIDYLPARSEHEGGLFFTSDPRDFTLRLRPEGYSKP